MIYKYGTKNVNAIFYGGILLNKTYYGSDSGISTLTLDPTFKPTLGTVTSVEAIAIDSSNNIYVGGNFTNNFNTFNTSGGDSGTIPPITTNGIVNAIGVSPGGDVYFGGLFTSITFNGTTYSKTNLAKFTGSNLAGTFIPNPNGAVNTIAVNSNYAFIGGAFTSIWGLTRNRFAKLNVSGDNLQSNNHPEITTAVNTIALIGNTAYLGIGTTSISTVDYYNVYTPLYSTFNGAINTIAAKNTSINLRVGGSFTTPSTYAAILDITGNIVTTPSIHTNGAVNVIAYDNANNLYMGGAFTSITIDGTTTSCKRLVKLTNNVLDDQFDSGITNGAVNTIAFDSNNNVYVGGTFTTINGLTYNKIAKYLYPT